MNRRGERWTEAEDAALLEATEMGDLKQVARQLGRGYVAASMRRGWLRGKPWARGGKGSYAPGVKAVL